MPIRASVFRIIHFIIPLNWEIQWRYMLFKGRLLYDFHPVCRWIMSGISVLLSVGNNMMNIAIGTMTLSVLKSMLQYFHDELLYILLMAQYNFHPNHRKNDSLVKVRNIGGEVNSRK